MYKPEHWLGCGQRAATPGSRAFLTPKVARRYQSTALAPLVAMAASLLLAAASLAAEVDPAAPEPPSGAEQSGAEQSGAAQRSLRQIRTKDGGSLVLYPPQVESWQDRKKIRGRLAVAVTPRDAEQPTFGAITIEAKTQSDLSTRQVRLFDFKLLRADFPTVPLSQSATLRLALQSALPDQNIVSSLDQVLANLERSEGAIARSVVVSNRPPPIYVGDVPTLLVQFDGEPLFAAIPGVAVEFAVNTNWILLRDRTTDSLYLLEEDRWLHANSLRGTWSLDADTTPESFATLPGDEWKTVRDNVPGRTPQPGDVAPSVIVSERPAELIEIEGAPRLEPIPETGLSWLANSDADVFATRATPQTWYFLVSGRWFESDSLHGPWSFATRDLPEDFARIPMDHARAHVRASVPGTSEAGEALQLSQLPHRATVERGSLGSEVEVVYQGEPEFVPIDGTSLAFAVNTDKDVIRSGTSYYLCYRGVWFVSQSPSGPWKLADEIPDEIARIAADVPVHHVSYVEVDSSTPETVTYLYTSGYTGEYATDDGVVYGTGYWYSPWVYWADGYPVWYGYPYSYGIGAYYNPRTGTFARGAHAYGPYGGIGAGAIFDPRTRSYARGASVFGPDEARGFARAWNPRTGAAAVSRQGSNVYASWGTTTVRRGSDWAQATHVSGRRGDIAAVRTSDGERRAVIKTPDGVHAPGDAPGSNVFAGDDGGVYRRRGESWERYNGSDGWSSVNIPLHSTRLERGQLIGGERPGTAAGGEPQRAEPAPGPGGVSPRTAANLNRDYRARSLGARRSEQIGSGEAGGEIRGGGARVRAASMRRGRR